MKKVSISLLALMAVVFAVTSAFTTQDDKMQNFKVYVGSFSQSPSVSEVELGSLEYDDPSAPSNIDLNNLKEEFCPEDAETVCVAEITDAGQLGRTRTGIFQ